MSLATNVSLNTNLPRIPTNYSENAQTSLQSKPSDQPKSNIDKQLRICRLSVLGALALVGIAYVVIQRQLQVGQCGVALTLTSRVSDNPIGSLFFQENLCNRVKDLLPKCNGLESKMVAADFLDTRCQNYAYPGNVLNTIETYGKEDIFLSYDALKKLPADNARKSAAYRLLKDALDAGHLRKAKEIFDDIFPESERQDKYEPFLYRGYIKYLCQSKDLAAVQDLIELETSPGFNSKIINEHFSLYHALRETKDFDFVLKVVSEFAAKNQFFSDLDLNTFVTDVLKSASPNRFEIAEQIADTVLSQTVKINLYKSIRDALVLNQLNTEALEQKIINIKKTKNLDPYALEENVWSLCNNKLFKEAEEEIKLFADPIIQLKAYMILYEAYQAEGGWRIFANPYQSRIDELKKVDFSQALKILTGKEPGQFLTVDIKILQEFATQLGQNDAANDFSELAKQNEAKIEKKNEQLIEALRTLNDLINKEPDFFGESSFDGSDFQNKVQDASQEDYDTLELTPQASTEDIKAAYKRLAVANHPDKNKGDFSAQDKFIKIYNAYNTIMKTKKGNSANAEASTKTE